MKKSFGNLLMSITFNHKVGQHGNQLFVILHAAIIAHDNRLKMRYPLNGLVKFKNNDDDIPYVENRHLITCNGNYENKHVHLKRGYYQNSSILNSYVSIIKNDILDLPPILKNTRDVVMHLRLDGFNHEGYNSHIIHPKWYISILDNLSFDTLYIVMDTKCGKVWHKQHEHKKKYLSYFSEYNHMIVSNNANDDFEFIRKFDKIICSNSTFCWWACFLSEASDIYIPPYWESKQSKLSSIKNSKIISDEYEYMNIITMESVATTFQ